MLEMFGEVSEVKEGIEEAATLYNRGLSPPAGDQVNIDLHAHAGGGFGAQELPEGSAAASHHEACVHACVCTCTRMHACVCTCTCMYV